MRGYFKDRRPYIDLEVFGVYPESKRKFTATIDTGFDGFLTLPLTEAFPLGLILQGSQTYIVADEGSMDNLVCYGTVVFGNKEIFVPIDLTKTTAIILAGNSLLEKLGTQLLIDYKRQKIEIEDK